MRLDEYLVNEGLISSRNRARHYVERGLVKVNGVTVTKPSKKVEYGSRIEIIAEDRPEGYFKLKGIQEQSGILQQGDAVLDIGSSAGGFLLYASPVVDRVTGIEFSEEFRRPLEAVQKECPNVTVVFADAFTMDVSTLETRFDVILNDMTVEPSASIEILSRFLPLLKKGGKVMQVLKLGDLENHASLIGSLEDKGLTVERVIEPEKREIYVVAIKN